MAIRSRKARFHLDLIEQNHYYTRADTLTRGPARNPREQ